MKQLLNDKQVAKFDMTGELITLFNRYPEIVTLLPDLATILPPLSADRDDISSVAVDRDEKKSSVKNVKPDARTTLGKYAFKYSRKLHAIGKLRNIIELNNLESLAISEIEKMRFSNFSEYATEILNYLKKYLLQLSGQKVTQADIDQFEAMIDEYKTTLQNTDATHSQGVGETEDLEEKFTRMMSKVYVIDDMIDGIRDEYPELCNAYDSARIIHNYGQRHRTEEEIALLKAKAAARREKARQIKREKAEKEKAERIRKLRAAVARTLDTPPAEINPLNDN